MPCMQPDIPDNLGMTPLLYATGQAADVKIAKMLIQAGADVNHRSKVRGQASTSLACAA